MQTIEDRFEKLVVTVTLLLACLMWYAAFNPSGANWGFHHLSFFPDWLKVTVPLLMVISVHRGVRANLVQLIDRLSHRYEGWGRPTKTVWYLLCLGIAVWLFWTVRQETYFLGDGYLAIRNLHAAVDADNIALSFKREPLSGYLTVQLFRLWESLQGVASDQKAFQSLSVISGVGSLVVMSMIARLLVPGNSGRVLLILLAVCTGSIQLFFGYVENYSLSVFGLLLFVYFGLANLKRSTSISYAIFAFGLLVSIHFGMAIMLPALVVLLIHGVSRGEIKPIAWSLVGSATMVVMVLILCDFTFDTFFMVTGRSPVHLVPLFASQEKLYAYSMFSIFHLLDWVNLQLLIHPYALITVALLVIWLGAKRFIRDEQLQFLVALAVMGTLFTVVINSELGMSRDWDLMAPFALGVVLLAVYFWSELLRQNERNRNVLVIVLLASTIHIVPWISVNASEVRSMSRFESLRDSRLWSRHAFADSYETLSIYFRDRGNEHLSIKYLEKYMTVDSTNPRLWMNLASAYGRNGDTEKAISAYERGGTLDTSSWDMQMQLGILYAQKGDFEQAFLKMERALRLNDRSAAIENNFGSMLLQGRGDAGAALAHFQRAIELDPKMPEPHYGIAYCYERLGRMEEREKHLLEYTRLQTLRSSPEGFR